MAKNLSKKEVLNKIDKFFDNISEKTPEDVKKIKNLAMGKHIRLGGKRKLFCKKCLMPYSGEEKTRVKNMKKIVNCENCGYTARWKIKTS